MAVKIPAPLSPLASININELPDSLKGMLDALVTRRLCALCTLSGAHGAPTCGALNFEAQISAIRHLLDKVGLGEWAYKDIAPLQQLYD